MTLSGNKLSFGVLALSLGLSLAQTCLAADPANGEKIATRWCYSCHLATDRQRSGPDLAPPFTGIANDATLSPDGLRDALTGRHTRMPDFALAREQIEDLSAYLRALRK